MKLVSLISSGIDSPVATYLVSKYSERVILLHADTAPFIEREERTVFLKLVEQLRRIISKPLSIYIVPHGIALKVFQENCSRRFTCILCKRMLIRYAESIARKENSIAIVMGDSLGQVASQTLYNIQVIDEVSSIPILRPLIGFDKEEITRIAKKIGTYSYSIAPFKCTATPKTPATKASLDLIKREEEKVDMKSLLEEILSKKEKIEV
ncbi:MAG: hypothetical protein DRN12_04045 [Thermoplasmata archaeon]|nr:MAG: hypothetical protein DRN12_04045 [Thermoplasmata archaeon]